MEFSTRYDNEGYSALDVRNRTAQVAVDLIESLFGKSTLMRRKIGRAHV